MTTAPLGSSADDVLTAAIRLPAHDYPTPQVRLQFLEQLTNQLEQWTTSWPRSIAVYHLIRQ